MTDKERFINTADIELVIRISEKDYKDILNGETKASALNWSTFNAIRNGIPLPKGHGDLIDRNKLLKDESGNSIYIVEALNIEKADTIIEADEEN